EARVARELGAAEDLGTEALPFALVLDGDDERFPVGGGEGAIGRDRGVAEADPGGRLAAVVLVDQRYRHPFGRRVEERDGKLRALAAAAARQQSLEDRGIGVEPRRDVGDRDADASRRL